MKKSGKTNRAEPTDLTWIDKFPECAELFSNAGGLTFFKKIDGYHVEVSISLLSVMTKTLCLLILCNSN